jgi:hypothetical protein
MTRRRIPLLLLLGGGLLVLLLVIYLLPAIERGGGAPERDTTAEAAGPSRAPDPMLGAGSGPQSRDRREGHDGKAGALLAGVVTASGGEPISGARLRWTALRVEDVEPNPVWRSLDWGWSERVSVETSSRADGSFAFTESPGDPQHGTVLLALHAGHVAAGSDLPTPESWSKPVRLVLDPGAPIRVRVVDDQGHAIEHAIVRHAACTEQPSSVESFALSPPEEIPRRRGHHGRRGTSRARAVLR